MCHTVPVSGLFRAAYSKTATEIFPFTPDVIIEDEFAPYYVIERNSDVVHQLLKMPDSETADANGARITIMTNESGNVTSLRIQSGNHD
jgi:hypothetical protein